MRKVTSYLFISLDGVVEAPDTFVRSDLYEDFDPLTAEMIAEQDAVRATPRGLQCMIFRPRA